MENDEEVRFQRAGNPHILCSINHVLLIFLQQNSAVLPSHSVIPRVVGEGERWIPAGTPSWQRPPAMPQLTRGRRAAGPTPRDEIYGHVPAVSCLSAQTDLKHHFSAGGSCFLLYPFRGSFSSRL